MKLPRLLLAASLLSLPAAHGDLFLTSTGPYPAPAGNAPNAIRGGWTPQKDYAGTVGVTFVVGASDLSVSAVGVYDGPNSAAANSAGTFGDGLFESHQVGIFDSAGTLLTPGVTIPAGTGATLINDFRYITLATPVTLLTGQSYTIAGQVPTAGGPSSDVFRDDGPGGFQFGSGFVRNNSRAYTGPPTNQSFEDGVFQAPNSDGAGYAGANFEYTVVPEPTTVALSLLSGLGMLVLRRLRA